MVQNELPRLLEIEVGDLLGGHVQLAREHRDHPGFVLERLLSVDGRGSRDRLAGRERLPELRSGDLDLLTQDQAKSPGRGTAATRVGDMCLKQLSAVEELLEENVTLARSATT